MMKKTIPVETYEKIMSEVEKEIEDKKIALYKLEGYILGTTKALAMFDKLRNNKEAEQ